MFYMYTWAWVHETTFSFGLVSFCFDSIALFRSFLRAKIREFRANGNQTVNVFLCLHLFCMRTDQHIPALEFVCISFRIFFIDDTKIG